MLRGRQRRRKESGEEYRAEVPLGTSTASALQHSAVQYTQFRTPTAVLHDTFRPRLRCRYLSVYAGTSSTYTLCRGPELAYTRAAGGGGGVASIFSFFSSFFSFFLLWELLCVRMSTLAFTKKRKERRSHSRYVSLCTTQKDVNMRTVLSTYVEILSSRVCMHLMDDSRLLAPGVRFQIQLDR